MSNLALQTGLRALLTAQFALDTIGNNLANANTVGYSRQRLQLGAASPLTRNGLLIGTGVNAESVQRSVDVLLGRRILNQVSVSGGLYAQFGGMSEIETAFAEPSDRSLGSMMDTLFARISELSTAPEDSILRTSVVQATLGVTSQFTTLAATLDRQVVDTEAAMGLRVDDVNQLAERIANLNLQIAQTETAGVSANSLQDERDRALNDLAQLANITTVAGTNGSVRVLVAGNTLVGSTRANEMELARDPGGDLAIKIKGSTGFVPVTGGALGGLLYLSQDFAPGLRGELDDLAKNLILEMNRLHSTGTPASGPFTSLTGTNAIEDRDGDGRVTDELLSNAGLPFDVERGELWVNVVELETGAVTKNKIEISKTHTTVQDLLDELNDIEYLSANLDATGRLRISSSAGYGFDFSSRIDPAPDMAGTFGSEKASIGSAQGPFSLADGDTLDLTIDNGGGPASFSIAFASADFVEIGQATAEEVADVINADSGAQANGVTASVVEGRVFVQTTSTGSDVSLTVDGGNAATAFDWTGVLGAPITGSDNAVDVAVAGVYTGDGNDVLTIQPNMDGTIGTTDGLTVDVFDGSGRLISTLDVGAGYQPGDELSLGNGVTLSFGLGELSATNNDLLALDVVADSDTSDVLVAFGLNALFTGSNAGDIGIRSDIEADAGLLSTSISGAPGDNSLLLAMLEVENRGVVGLAGQSPGQFYANIIGGVGFQVAVTNDALEASETLMQGLAFRRDQVSGVNIDEELVDLIRYEQAFGAASRFITTVNQLNDELLALI